MPKVELSPQLLAFQELNIQFAQSLLRTVAQRFERDGSKQTLRKRLQIDESGWMLVPHFADAYENYLPLHDDPFFERSEARRCAKAFVDAGLAGRLTLTEDSGARITDPTFEELYPFVTYTLTDPIRHLLRTSSSARFGKRKMETLLTKYMDIWLDTHDMESSYAPLYNLRSELNSIKIDEFLSIVPFSRERKTELFSAMGPLAKVLDIQNYVEASHAVVLKRLDASHSDARKDEIRRRSHNALQIAITSLRLIKSEFVGTTGFMRFDKLTSMMRTSGGIRPLEDFDIPKREYFQENYTFDRTELSYFRRYYRMLECNEFAIWNALELPLRQFNRCCRRQRDEDRILDTVTCMESMLLRGGDRELQYRLCLMAARLLRAVRSPQDTFNQVKCLYELRSKIIHENEPISGSKCIGIMKRRGLDPSDFMKTTECLSREILVNIIGKLRRGETLDELRSRLEDDIVTAVGRS